MNMKGITCCADCAYYNAKKHRCTRATDEGKPTDHFYADCPLPTVTNAQGWISVKDRLPEDGVMVIVAVFGHDVIVQHEGETLEMAINRTLQHKRVTVGFFDEEGFWYGADGYPMIVQPSYWMPLPEPPKEDEA